MADLSSILGGMIQGFKDFGTGVVDLFGTGGAAIGDAIASIQNGRATTKNQDDFRKWLYQTDDKQDASAKGLGTILNGVSTVADVIPGTQAVTANPLFNGIQGAIGGVSDELKMYGKDADAGRALQRAGVGAASGLASAYAGQKLQKTGNKMLSNGLTRGAVQGAIGGGIANAGYAGIEGGSVQDMINAGLYGAQTGALVGGTTGLARELIKPTHKMDVALTDDEKAARIANIDDQLGKLDLSTPEGNARYNELMDARQKYSGNKRLYRGLTQEYDANYPKNKLDTNGYESWTDNPELAKQYGEYVYYIDVPEGDIKTSYLDENPMSETYGDRNPIYSIDKKAGLNGVSGNEYLLSVDDPYKEGLTYNRLGGKPQADEMLKLYRGISAPDDATLQRYIDDMKNPDIEPTNYSGGSAYGKGYYFTPDEGLARYYASESGLPSTAVLEIEVPKNRFTEISKANGNRPADFDLAAIKRGVPEDIRYETGLKDFNDYLDSNGYWGSKTSDDGTYTIMRNDAVLNAKKVGDTPKTVADLMNEPKQKTVADLMLSPEQEEFFKDSQLRDENGKLMRVYHSSPNKFTEFDDARLGNNTAYDNTAFGHFVTNDRDFSSRFRDIDNRGIDGYTMELYANAKKPITHPYEAAYKYSGNELDNIVKNYYKETNNPEALAAIKEWADESGQSLYEAYMDMSVDENPFEMAAAERKALQGKGYDAVEFVEGRKSGLVDGSTDETPISSYAIFSGNQLKDIKNRKPTSNPNINYALAGILGTGGLAAAMAAATPKEDKKKKSEVK